MNAMLLTGDLIKELYPDALPSAQDAPPKVSLGNLECIRMDSLADDLVCVFTGFKSGQKVKEEFLACGGDELMAKVDLHAPWRSKEALPRVVEQLKRKRMVQESVLNDVVQRLQNDGSFERKAKKRSRTSKVPRVNLFLLPFVVLRLALPLKAVGALSFYYLSASQISLALRNVLEILAPVWQQRWCPPRSLSWLEKYCVEDGKLVIMVDGTDVETEKPMEAYMQRMLYGKKNKHLAHVAARFLTFSSKDQWLVHLSSPGAASLSEVAMLRHDDFLTRLDEEARRANRLVEVEVILDRGYYFWKPDPKWTNLRVTRTIPSHLVAPGTKKEKRENKEKKARGEKVPKRMFFPKLEALRNKIVAKRRIRNEQANRRFKVGRLFRKVLPIKLLPRLRKLTIIAWGQANMAAKCPPEQVKL